MQAGERYPTNSNGDLIVVEYRNARSVRVKFVEYPCEVIATAGNIRAGRVKNPNKPLIYGVGYIGVGSYIATENGKRSKAYACWSGMLERCYCKKRLAKFPTYQGCTVSPQWHCFQDFARWFDDNYINGFHLDKDLKVMGNKVYSPETCCFVPVWLNTFFITGNYSSDKELPMGIVAKGNGFVSQVSDAGSRINSFHSDKDVAYATYRSEKRRKGLLLIKKARKMSSGAEYNQLLDTLETRLIEDDF